MSGGRLGISTQILTFLPTLRGRIDTVICRKHRLPFLTAGSTLAAGGLLFCRSGLFCAFVPFRHRCSGGIQSCRRVVLLRRLGRSCLGPTGWLKDIELPLFRHLSHPNCPFFFSSRPKKDKQETPASGSTGGGGFAELWLMKKVFGRYRYAAFAPFFLLAMVSSISTPTPRTTPMMEEMTSGAMSSRAAINRATRSKGLKLRLK